MIRNNRLSEIFAVNNLFVELVLLKETSREQ